MCGASRPPAIMSVSSPTVSRMNLVCMSEARELRDIGRTRVLARRVEPVGADEMRVASPSSAACSFISFAKDG